MNGLIASAGCVVGFFNCILYLLLIGFLGFVIGRLVPKKWFLWDRAPWKSTAFEKDGSIFRLLNIRYWQDRIPDMSRVFPMLMQQKKLPRHVNRENLELMIRETCVAEFIHDVLGALGFGCLFLWNGAGGMAVALSYAFGNFPFIIVQRYNRPRLVRLLQKVERRGYGQKYGKSGGYYAYSDTELQYGAGTQFCGDGAQGRNYKQRG